MRRSRNKKGMLSGESSSYRESLKWYAERKEEIAAGIAVTYLGQKIPAPDPGKQKRFRRMLRRLRRMGWSADDRECVRAAAWAVGIGN